MTDARHSKQTLANGIHSMVAYEYANATAREAATGFVSADLYKIAIETDTKNLYILTAISPATWIYFGNVSQELNKVQITCRKSTTGTLTVGTIVYANGYNHVNDYATVEAAKADSASTLPAVGVISKECTDTSSGKVMVVGVLSGLDTSSWSSQDPLYVSESSAGQFRNTPPSGPYVAQNVGVVLNSDASNGHIGVNIQNYRAIEYTTTPQNLGTAAAGTSNESSASDHIHNMPSASDVGAAPSSHGSANHTGTIGAHSQLSSVGINDHHVRDHASTHGPGGQDALKLDDLATPDDNTDLNASTSAHGLLKKLSNVSSEFLNGQGNWSVPVFGSQYQTARSDGESSTTSATPQQKLRLTTSSLPAGDYRIGWYFEHACSANDKLNSFRVQLDDTTDIYAITEVHKGAYGDSVWYSIHGQDRRTLTSGVHTIDIDFWTDSDTLYVKNARIELWRVS